ncbi:MAG: AAA family ATPase [Spirochaetaceae bacterium]|nr:AAA family ATPase [Spirochaetaceae bacterium]
MVRNNSGRNTHRNRRRRRRRSAGAAGIATYFLSRPRRFGKSLFLDTLKELFESNEPLFRGLHVHDRWNWSERCPVVRLDFAGGSFKEPGSLQEDVTLQLEYLEETAGVPAREVGAPGRFRRLLQAMHRQTGQRVVVLVDEYDKPILDALANPEMAVANRDFLRGFYGMMTGRLSWTTNEVGASGRRRSAPCCPPPAMTSCCRARSRSSGAAPPA